MPSNRIMASQRGERTQAGFSRSCRRRGGLDGRALTRRPRRTRSPRRTANDRSARPRWRPAELACLRPPSRVPGVELMEASEGPARASGRPAVVLGCCGGTAGPGGRFFSDRFLGFRGRVDIHSPSALMPDGRNGGFKRAARWSPDWCRCPGTGPPPSAFSGPERSRLVGAVPVLQRIV